MQILDLGCGPGTITTDFASLAPQGSVTGIDSSAAVLEQARVTAASRGVQNVQFFVGDIQALDYPDDTFDLVHVHQVLQHVGDPVQALREMRRVAKPGGIVAAREADFSAMTWYPEMNGLHEWQELYLRVARANGGEPDAGRRLHVWAREAGFQRGGMTLTVGTWCFSTPEERCWWSGMWADRMVDSDLAKSATKRGLATGEKLDSIAQAWRDWGEEDDGWFAMLHGEILCRKSNGSRE